MEENLTTSVIVIERQHGVTHPFHVQPVQVIFLADPEARLLFSQILRLCRVSHIDFYSKIIFTMFMQIQIPMLRRDIFSTNKDIHKYTREEYTKKRSIIDYF